MAWSASHRLYIMFYVLYLITLAIAAWFLLFYSGVPSWIWILFGIAIVSLISAVVLKEFFVVQYSVPAGTALTMGPSHFWFWLYILFQVIALILLIVGLVFTIQYSNVPAWIWAILGLGVALIGLSDIIYTLAVDWYWLAVTSVVIGILLLIGGAIGFGLNSTGTLWWVSAILGVAIVFAIIAAIFEALAPTNDMAVATVQSTQTSSAFLPIQATFTQTTTQPMYMTQGTTQPMYLIQGTPQQPTYLMQPVHIASGIQVAQQA